MAQSRRLTSKQQTAVLNEIVSAYTKRGINDGAEIAFALVNLARVTFEMSGRNLSAWAEVVFVVEELLYGSEAADLLIETMPIAAKQSRMEAAREKKAKRRKE